MQPSRDLTRTTLGVLFVLALILFSGWIVLPFLSALLWAATIVISTWPVLLRIQSALGGRRGRAAAVLTILLLLMLVVPLTLAVASIVGSIDTIVANVAALETFTVPPPPEWVARIPFAGPRLAAEWQGLSVEGPGSVATRLAPYSARALRWFGARVGSVGGMVLQFLLTVMISAMFYLHGETAARGVRKFAVRLAGAHGDRAAVLAAGTIRGVALGVIGTAAVQTAIATAGLLITSVPGAGLFAAGALILCLAQLGPVLVLLPAVIWKFHTGESLGGSVLLAFALVAGTIDQFVRPYLIRKGADLPLPVILAGVIGGMIGFGIMGIFVGPVILAVTHVLLREWVNSQPEAEPVEAAGTPALHR